MKFRPGLAVPWPMSGMLRRARRSVFQQLPGIAAAYSEAHWHPACSRASVQSRWRMRSVWRDILLPRNPWGSGLERSPQARTSISWRAGFARRKCSPSFSQKAATEVTLKSWKAISASGGIWARGDGFRRPWKTNWGRNGSSRKRRSINPTLIVESRKRCWIVSLILLRNTSFSRKRSRKWTLIATRMGLCFPCGRIGTSLRPLMLR